MRIKTFQAPTMQEALSLARGELGDEAVVLNTRQVKAGGLLGLGTSCKVEVTAAVEASPDPVPVAVAVEDPPLSVYDQRAAVATSTPVQADPEIAQLRLELKQLTSVVHGLLSANTAPHPPAGGGSDVPFSTTPRSPLLLRLGVDEDIARRFLPELLDIEEPCALVAALAEKMKPFAQPPVLDSPRVIAVVGPTGVGKTTTLAKLAARFSLEQGKKVALVTADTFRIGAVEQLRTYARIMGVPLEIALSPQEVRAGVDKHASRDVVLIDTVGRSHRNPEHLTELRAFLEVVGEVETHLVVAASLATEVQREVVESFSIFSPSRLVITKLDESPIRGCLVNLPMATGLAISCTTAGQNVPQDIQFAEAGAIARAVVEVG